MKTKIDFIFTLLFFVALSISANAQNNVPDSVFIKETFGTGTTKTALPAGRTTYVFNNTSSLNDGDYMLYNRTNGRPEWHNTSDHTGDANGKAMIINAGYSNAEFYKDTVFSLTPNTNYSVYLYVMNTNTLGTCGATALLPKLQFIVEYYNQSTATYLQLTSVTTAFIPQSAAPTWQIVGSSFLLPAGVTSVRYKILNSSTGGCGNDLAIDDITFARASIIPTLPVTGLEAFVQGKDKNVEVLWQTLSEYNTSIYIVEKSIDAVNWLNIDTVTAAGNSQSKRNYSIIDMSPNNINYYRIKQIDENRRYTYSNIVRIVFNNYGAKAVTYPNPFVSFVQVDINSDKNKIVTINFKDVSGRILLKKQCAIIKGNNSIAISQVQQLPVGMYILNINTDDGSCLYKTTILKSK